MARNVSNLSSLTKSVIFLSKLPFHISSPSEVQIRDDPFQSRRNLRNLRISKSGNTCLSIDRDVIRSSTDLATSTSLIHNFATVGWLGRGRAQCVKEFIEMQLRDLISQNFHHTILRISSFCTIQKIPCRKLPGKARSRYCAILRFFSEYLSLFRNFVCIKWLSLVRRP